MLYVLCFSLCLVSVANTLLESPAFSSSLTASSLTNQDDVSKTSTDSSNSVIVYSSVYVNSFVPSGDVLNNVITEKKSSSVDHSATQEGSSEISGYFETIKMMKELLSEAVLVNPSNNKQQLSAQQSIHLSPSLHDSAFDEASSGLLDLSLSHSILLYMSPVIFTPSLQSVEASPSPNLKLSELESDYFMRTNTHLLVSYSTQEEKSQSISSQSEHILHSSFTDPWISSVFETPNFLSESLLEYSKITVVEPTPALKFVPEPITGLNMANKVNTLSSTSSSLTEVSSSLSNSHSLQPLLQAIDSSSSLLQSSDYDIQNTPMLSSDPQIKISSSTASNLEVNTELKVIYLSPVERFERTSTASSSVKLPGFFTNSDMSTSLGVIQFTVVEEEMSEWLSSKTFYNVNDLRSLSTHIHSKSNESSLNYTQFVTRMLSVSSDVFSDLEGKPVIATDYIETNNGFININTIKELDNKQMHVMISSEDLSQTSPESLYLKPKLSRTLSLEKLPDFYFSPLNPRTNSKSVLSDKTVESFSLPLPLTFPTPVSSSYSSHTVSALEYSSISDKSILLSSEIFSSSLSSHAFASSFSAQSDTFSKTQSLSIEKLYRQHNNSELTSFILKTLSELSPPFSLPFSPFYQSSTTYTSETLAIINDTKSFLAVPNDLHSSIIPITDPPSFFRNVSVLPSFSRSVSDFHSSSPFTRDSHFSLEEIINSQSALLAYSESLSSYPITTDFLPSAPLIIEPNFTTEPTITPFSRTFDPLDHTSSFTILPSASRTPAYSSGVYSSPVYFTQENPHKHLQPAQVISDVSTGIGFTELHKSFANLMDSSSFSSIFTLTGSTTSLSISTSLVDTVSLTSLSSFTDSIELHPTTSSLPASSKNDKQVKKVKTFWELHFGNLNVKKDGLQETAVDEIRTIEQTTGYGNTGLRYSSATKAAHPWGKLVSPKLKSFLTTATFEVKKPLNSRTLIVALKPSEQSWIESTTINSVTDGKEFSFPRTMLSHEISSVTKTSVFPEKERTVYTESLKAFDDIGDKPNTASFEVKGISNTAQTVSNICQTSLDPSSTTALASIQILSSLSFTARQNSVSMETVARCNCTQIDRPLHSANCPVNAGTGRLI